MRLNRQHQFCAQLVPALPQLGSDTPTGIIPCELETPVDFPKFVLKGHTS
jgi:hypothetical protein